MEGGKKEDPLVDASGVMPDGRKFQDANHFKQLLLEDRDKFLRAFIEHLSTYSLHRLRIALDGNPIVDFVVRDDKILRPYFANARLVDGRQVTRNHPPVRGSDAVDHDTMHPGIWETWGQPARWCDYTGTDPGSGGILLMAGPDNFRESWWHDRDDGAFVANPFGRESMR